MAADNRRKSKKEPHILIVRLSAMGDVAILPPVVRTLRNDFPDLKITVLTRPAFKVFFRDIDGIEFITPDLRKQHKGLRGILRLGSEILQLGVTHMADVHDVLRTKLLRRLLLLSGIKVAVIDKGRAEKRALTRKYHKYKVQLEPSYERYRDVVRQLGFCMSEPKAVERRTLPVPQDILAIAGPKTGRWVGISPFAKHFGKIYPTSLSAELIGLLSTKYEHVFVFGGGALEKEFAECMDGLHENVHSIIGKISLSDELDLISNMDAMVTMDSSPMHLSSLAGTPVVSVWGATHPFAGFYGFGQDPDNAVQLDLPCRPCSVYGNKPCIYHDYRCLHGIAPQTIFEQVEKVLGQTIMNEGTTEHTGNSTPEIPARTKKAEKAIERPCDTASPVKKSKNKKK